MSTEGAVGSAVALVLLIYLVYTLLRPERF